MPYVADLHIHSRFSRACSQEINIANMAKWAKIKGIDLLGTGDCLHSLWQNEIKKVLKERGDGFLEYDGVKFILSTEISCIYTDKQSLRSSGDDLKGKLRRIHLVILLPSLEAMSRLSTELIKKRVNLASDGRPITGLTAKNILEIVLGVEPLSIIIPAHIWTPHFALFGSNSGYNFLEECFEELSDQILAVETGLSSDPAMNWRVANLDKKAIISCSDAHSLPNLAREVTIFKGQPSFNELRNDLKTQNIVGTIEFFPEEGMYHFSGHRNCNIVRGPEEIKKEGEICPVCGKKLTIGVMERVEELATRSTADLKIINDQGVIRSGIFPERPGFRMIVGLEKIIGEALLVGAASLKVKNEYFKLIENLDNELMILTKSSLGEITKYCGEKIAEGVGRVREGKLQIEPGHDGVYGKIKIWGEQEEESKINQIGLF